LAGSSGKVCASEHVEEPLSRRKGGSIDRRHTSGSRPAAPRRSLDLLAGNRPSHRSHGQGEEDETANGQSRGDDIGSARRHGTRLEEKVSDPPSALAGTIDACRQSQACVPTRTVEILVNKIPANESSVVPDLDPPDCLGQRFDGWLRSRLIPHRHRPRAELQPAHELQVDMLR
jgi:hypothetical protein